MPHPGPLIPAQAGTQPAPAGGLDPALAPLVEALARLARARQLARTQEKR